MLRKTFMSVVVGLTVLATTSFASVTDLHTSLRKTGEKSFALYLNGLSTNVQIVITDQEGHTLYKEQLKDQERFAKNFNLDNLNEGGYELRIEDGTKINSIQMNIEGKTVLFNEEEVTFKPSTSINNSRVHVAMSDMNDSELEVVIKDHMNDQVFMEVVENKEEGLDRIYDLSKIAGGEYTFIFYSNGHTFIQPVNIKK
jgi:flagellar hook assembly protein FlgD